MLTIEKISGLRTEDGKRALLFLDKHKTSLTKQQYDTFKGQIKSGDINGFKKGIHKKLNCKF